MSKRGIAILLGLALVVAAGTLVQDFRFDSRIAAERAAGLETDRALGGAATALADLRAAQAGYVGTGQAPASWMTRATEAFDRIDQAIARRRSVATPDTAPHYARATQALDSLRKIDGRARTSVDAGDRLHASDLIYIDAVEFADALTAEIAAARAIEHQASSDRASRFGMFRLAMNGLAVVLLAIIALYFGRALTILSQRPPASTAQMLKDLPPPVKHGASSAAVATPAPATPALPVPRLPLAAAAELCVDLARVLDGRDVPALLERTATLIDAKGIMIWSADTGGALLRPTMCHGYSEKVISRLRPLQVDADNVTSLAFRSLQPQTIPGAGPAESSAIAVPLITSSGCVGVLAAEVRQSRPHADLLPLIRIVAAQFATLVGPTDEGLSSAAQG